MLRTFGSKIIKELEHRALVKILVIIKKSVDAIRNFN